MESGGGDGNGSSGKRDNKNHGNLRVDTGATATSSRRITQPSEPSSPQPSVDRLSVSFAPDDNKSLSDSEFPGGHGGGGLSVSELSKVNLFNMADTDAGGTQQNIPLGMRLSTTGVTDEDDDYSASMTAILHRRGSARKIRGLGKRRTSSPLDSDRRRSSVFTTSSGETAITVDGEGGPASQEAIFENIRLHKEVLESIKNQPWEMRRKLKMVQQAKEYVRRHEGQLQERLAQSKSTKDIMARFNILLLRYWQYIKREAANMATFLTPWEMRIKEIESHFGSVVASYFTFLRWVFWINIVITAIIVCLVIVPEMLGADEDKIRKKIPEAQLKKSTDLSTLWDFEGVLKYSPMFYGFYTNQPKSRDGYPLPLSYFLTGLGVYVYSFVAILRRMAKNSRQSKLSEKEDECIFSWKLFTGWDYMIGNPETAFNRFASITMGFKEALLEEKEKKKDERNWKVIGLRVLANILVLMLLAISSLAVVEVVKRSEYIKDQKGVGWWRENEITLVMSLITNIFPNIFELIGMLEKYHPRKQLRWQLARIMSLNFLNLYTLIIALFGNVKNMTKELADLRPKTTLAPMTVQTIFEVCGNVSVDCTDLDEFYFTQNVKQTSDILTLLTTAALITNYVANGTMKILPNFNETLNGISTSLDHQRDLQDLIQLLSPKLDFTESVTHSPDDQTKYKEINDKEYILLNDSEQITRRLADLRPIDESTMKTALPLIIKLFYSLIPDRIYHPITTPSTFLNTTSNISSTPTTTESWNETGSSSSSSSSETGSSTSPLYTEEWSSSPSTGISESETIPPSSTSTTYTDSRYSSRRRENRGRNRGGIIPRRNIRESYTEQTQATSPDEEGVEYTSGNLVLSGNGPNSYQSGPGKLSTRGDIPGHVTETELTSTTSPPDDNTEKLLTNIILVIEMIVKQNSSRTDFADLTTIDKLAEFVTSYNYHSETRRASYPYNTTVSAGFNRSSKEFDIKKCYIFACENGTVSPSGIIEFLNCSDFQCMMNRLVGNNTTCFIPGSKGCMVPEPTVAPTFDPYTSKRLSELCWETMFGQELVKLTVMDLIFTVGMILLQDFIRAILVRVLNPCWCWDLEKKFPQYGDFKIAENILHLVNNQGMIWMGMFFSPGLPAINLVKLVILMYIRSWTVMTCNVPHETVFRASRSNNFYFALLLFMLFLCTLPVGYAIVALQPSWHCGPFSGNEKMYKIFTDALFNFMPEETHDAISYVASPGIIIPLLVLLILIIYYLLSLTGSLREANNDLKSQLRRERTEERRKMFRIAGGKNEKETPFTRWSALIPVVKSVAKPGAEKPPSVLTTGKQTGFAGFAKRAALKAREKQMAAAQQDDGNATDMDQVSLPEDIVALPKRKTVQQQKPPIARKPSCTDSVASIRSEIPVIKISKEEDASSPGTKKEKEEIPTTTTTIKSHIKPSPTPTPSGSTSTTTAVTVEPTKKARVLKAIIDKSKKDRSQMEIQNEKVKPERKVEEEKSTNMEDFSETNPEDPDSLYFLNVDEEHTDVRRFFIRFQTGFESQSNESTE